MGVEEGTSNGEGAEGGKEIKCLKSEPVNNELGSVFVNDSGDGSSGASESFRTFKRQRQLKSSSKIKVQDGVGAPTDQVTHPLTDHFASSNDSNYRLQRKWRNVVLEHMHQLLSGDEGGIQLCIQDALLFHQHNGCNVTVKDSDTSHDDKQNCSPQAGQIPNGTQHTAEGQEGVTSNGSCKELNPQTTTEMCQRVFFDVIISEEFTSLCKLLFDNFQGIKLDKPFHLSLINSRMKEGVYEHFPLLFSSDIQKVWNKLQEVGTEIISLAKSLSNISSTSYIEHVGCSGGAVEEEKHESCTRAETLAKPEQIEACGVYKVCTCRYCGKKVDGKDCLVCDSCEEMYHVACMEPALEVIPPKSWYCSSCTSIGMGSPLENSVYKVCTCRYCGVKADGKDCLVCDSCEEMYHVACIEPALKVIPPESWYCGSCTGNGMGSPHENCVYKVCTCRYCGVKADGQDCLVCDSCEEMYHVACIEPALKVIPPESWYCGSCTSNGMGSPHENCVYKVCTCRYCGNKAEGKDCLVCDSCKEMYHVACIEPALKVIPPKSSYCSSCTSNGRGSLHENCVICDRLNSPRTLNDNVADENFETFTELEENSNCSVDDELPLSPVSNAQRVCKMCGSDIEMGEKLRTCGHSYCSDKYYHVRCLTMEQLKTYCSSWYCPSCLCRTCLVDKDDDKIVLCDGCDAAYHIYCMKPPQTSIPRGKWFCRKCDTGIQRIRRCKRAYERKLEMKGTEGNNTACDNLELSSNQKEKEEPDNKSRGGMDMLPTAATTLNATRMKS